MGAYDFRIYLFGTYGPRAIERPIIYTLISGTPKFRMFSWEIGHQVEVPIAISSHTPIYWN